MQPQVSMSRHSLFSLMVSPKLRYKHFQVPINNSSNISHLWTSTHRNSTSESLVAVELLLQNSRLSRPQPLGQSSLPGCGALYLPRQPHSLENSSLLLQPKDILPTYQEEQVSLQSSTFLYGREKKAHSKERQQNLSWFKGCSLSWCYKGVLVIPSAFPR